MIVMSTRVSLLLLLILPLHYVSVVTGSLLTPSSKSEKKEQVLSLFSSKRGVNNNRLVGGIRWNNLSVSVPKKNKKNSKKKGRKSRGSKSGNDDSSASDSDSDNLEEKDLCLLQPSFGFVQNGHVCAIIGPSGAGKSTLLAALSGTTPKESGKQVSGSVWVDYLQNERNDESISDSDNDSDNGNDNDTKNQISKSFLSIKNGEVAFLSQNDSFFSMLTPRETLNLATFLQLDINKEERIMLIDSTLDKLGLRHVESRRIGSPAMGHSGNVGVGSLSGGERRRLSVALELVTNPMVFIADEPTTGLDSSQAQKVFNVIAETARERNIPCICTIHQPRASIWKELDSFILLAPGGKMIYMGKRTDAVSYFASLGYKCPPATTTAEFFIDLVTIDTEDDNLAAIDIARINYLTEAFKRRQEQIIDSNNNALYDPPKVSKSNKDLRKVSHRPFLSRLRVLLVRSLRQNFRDLRVNLLRGTASISLAVLFSELFSGVKKGKSRAKSVADRTALLSFGVINMCMLALMKTLNLFGKEKPVVAREQMRKQYSSFEYLLSKLIGEMPLDALYSILFAASLKHLTSLTTPLSLLCGTFGLMTVAASSIGFVVGSLTSGVEEAMTAGMPIMVVFMAVGIINPSGVDDSVKVPYIIQLLKRMSPIGMAIEALVIAEYKGMDFSEDGRSWSLRDLPRMGGLALVRNGDQVIDALGLKNKTYEGVMKNMAAVSAINLFVSWFGLTWCDSKFMKAKDISTNCSYDD